MSHSLENQFLQFTLNPDNSSWSLRPAQGDLAVEKASLGLAFRLGKARFHTLERWSDPHLSLDETSSPHGALRRLSLALPPDANGLRCTVEFALPDEHTIFLWRMIVHNTSPQPIFLDRLLLLHVGSTSLFNPQSSITNLQSQIPNLHSPAFFSNGWGSWNYTGVYGAADHFRRTRLGPIASPARINAGTPQPRQAGRFASDMFGVLGDRRSRQALLAGFLSQKVHFGSLEARLDGERPSLSLWANGDGARLDPGSSLATDWACLAFLAIDDPDPLNPYLDAVARQHGLAFDSPLLARPSPSGWCSWYYYYQKITPRDLQRNLEGAARLRPELPLEVFQIDDGFEPRVGDWLESAPAFPDGVAPLARQIREAGFTPGLWLAPFIVDPRSRLAREHPDWLLRGRMGRPVNAGYIWDVFTTALDLTHPAALDYAVEVVRTASHEWGFPYLKLDFLYAAALPGRYRDPTRTRAQVLRTGLGALRQAAGDDAFLLGCGCPLGSALGLVDAMRIGSDTDSRWHPAYKGIQHFFSCEPDFPSARNAMHNTLTRLPLHRRWWLNDPDCLLLRPEALFTLDEVQSMAAIIALTDGILLLSDDLPSLPPDRLRIAQSLLPPLGGRLRVLDWFDSATPSRLSLDLENASGAWSLLALFNWGDAPRDVSLRLEDFGLIPAQEYWLRDFWRGQVHRLAGGAFEHNGLPAHGVLMLAVRAATSGQPQYLGGDLHISQGQEVVSWNREEGELAFQLRRPGRATGNLDLSLPASPQAAWLQGSPIDWQATTPGCYRFTVEFDSEADVMIRF